MSVKCEGGSGGYVFLLCGYARFEMLVCVRCEFMSGMHEICVEGSWLNVKDGCFCPGVDSGLCLRT